ncbi:MAG: hypothetical protein ACPLPS_01815 [bacterium]
MPEQELIKEQTVEAIFKSLALYLPIMGILLATIILSITKKFKYFLLALGFGLLGPINLLLWRVYGFVLDRFGFDSVKAFFINLTLFLFLGICLGYLIGYFANKSNINKSKKEV